MANKKYFVYKWFSIYKSRTYYMAIDISLAEKYEKIEVLKSIYDHAQKFHEHIRNFSEENVAIIEDEEILNGVDEQSLKDLSKNQLFDGSIEYMNEHVIEYLIPLFDFKLAKKHGYEGNEEEYTEMAKETIEEEGFPYNTWAAKRKLSP